MSDLSAAIASGAAMTARTTDTASSAHDLPSLSVNSQTDLPLKHSGFIGALGQSFFYSAVQAPLEGVSQVFDHTIGSPINSHLYKTSKNLLVKAPEAAEYGSAAWYGQNFGGALGVLPWFMLTRSGLRAAEGSLAVTRGLVVESAEAALNKSLFSATGAKLALEGGLTGAAHAGLFQPSAEDNNYWSAKSDAMGKGFVTFTAMTASSVYLGAKFGPVAQQLSAHDVISQAVTSRGAAALAGALSAVPAATADMAFDYVSSGGKNKENLRDFGKNVYSYAVVGAGLSMMPGLPEHGGKASQVKLSDGIGPAVDLSKSDLSYKNLVAEPKYKYVSSASNIVPGKDVGISLIPDDHSKAYSDSQMLLPPWQRTGGFAPGPIGKTELPPLSVSELAQHFTHLPNALEFAQKVGENRVGALPEGFATGDPSKDKMVFSHLDLLAQALRKLDASLPAQKKSGLGAEDLGMPAFQLNLSGHHVEVTKIGVGEVSHVYKLSSEGHDYAFKVPNDPSRMDVHGVSAETAAFVYLAKNQISDLIDFHAANTSPKGGWILTEYVSKPVERSGVPLANVLADQGLKLGDDWSANRGPGNVVWDLGGIEPLGVKSPKNLAQFKDLLATTEGKMIAGRKFDGISDQSELKQALLISLQHPEIGGQVARTAARNLHRNADLHDVLSVALQTKGAAGRAAFELDRLSGTPYIKGLFYKALNNPESRVEASKMIDKLLPEDRKGAFDAAFKYREARAMATKSIASLPDKTDRAAAAEMAKEYPGSNFVLYQGLSKYRNLTASENVDSQKALQQYLEGNGLYTVHTGALGADKASFKSWFNQVYPDYKETYKNANAAAPAVPNTSNIEHVWPDLTQSQRTLSPADLNLIADSWSALSTAQWKTLSSKEAVQFAKLSEDLSISEMSKVYADPQLSDLLNALSKNDRVFFASTIVKNWREMPESFKTLGPDDALILNRAWPLLPDTAWAKISADDIVHTALTVEGTRSLSIDRDGSAKFLEFAKWNFANSSSLFDTDLRAVRQVYRAWDKLSPDQKNLPVEQLLARANMIMQAKKLEISAGVSAKVAKYVSEMDVSESEPLNQLTSWINNVGFAKDEVLKDSILAHLDNLVDQNAAPDQFHVSAVERKVYMDRFFGSDNDLRAKLSQALPTTDDVDALLSFVHNNPEQNARFADFALNQGYLNSKTDWKALSDASRLSSRLNLRDEDDYSHLLKLQGYFKFDQLVDYLDEHPQRVAQVRDLVKARVSGRQLDANRLVEKDQLENMDQFSPAQITQLGALHEQGLSILRLSNHIGDNSEKTQSVYKMLADGYDAKRITDVMRLSVFPVRTAIEVEKAVHAGYIKIEDVLDKVRDFKAGSNFRSLMIARVARNQELSGPVLNKLFATASEGNKLWPVRNMRTNKYDLEMTPTAETYVMAAKNILSTIPKDKPIVVLGRDAWPLVPLLRAHGRVNVQYFLRSRLQSGDSQTDKQWLKEIPPGAVVIDSGFNGSILNRTKEIDSTISGAMLDSNYPDIYPNLLKSSDRNSRVQAIEKQIKLISRTTAHTVNGGAVSRRNAYDSDVDTPTTLARKSVWYAQAKARETLSAMGLPEWEAWRYSQFTGLTPKERLGVRTQAEVQQHYDVVAAMRQQVERPDFTSSSH